MTTTKGRDPADLQWRKSTRSQYTPSRCVEVAAEENRVMVRDSKNPDGPILQFSPEEWDAFVEGVKDNEFDLS